MFLGNVNGIKSTLIPYIYIYVNKYRTLCTDLKVKNSFPLLLQGLGTF